MLLSIQLLDLFRLINFYKANMTIIFMLGTVLDYQQMTQRTCAGYINIRFIKAANGFNTGGSALLTIAEDKIPANNSPNRIADL